MTHYQIKKNSLEVIKENPFKLEKEIQNVVELNLKRLLNLEFVSTEFSVSGTTHQFRIDTLAFDPINKVFVIIEYKRGTNFSVVDQGAAYLSTLFDRKADFILEYNEKNNVALNSKNIDWPQSRVIFIAQDFTAYQREAINFQNMPIALWQIKRYTNDTISFEELRARNPAEKLSMIAKTNTDLGKISEMIKVYAECDLTQKAPENIVALYEQIKEEILNIGNIEIKATKLYIAFTVQGCNFVDIAFLQKGLKIWLNLKIGELDDPYKLMRDVSKTGHYGNGDYEMFFDSPDKLDYLLTMIRQSYNKKK